MLTIFPEESPSRTGSKVGSPPVVAGVWVDRPLRRTMLIESRLSPTLFNIEQGTARSHRRYSRVTESRIEFRYGNRRLPEDDPDRGVLATARYRDRVRRNF